MLSNLIVQRLLYEIPTIGKSFDIAATAVVSSHEFFEPGLWIIQNMGPDVAYLKMFPSDTQIATIGDFPLFPYGSQDMSSIMIQIGMIDRKLKASGLGHYPDKKFLSVICGAGDTATLRATRMTKD